MQLARWTRFRPLLIVALVAGSAAVPATASAARVDRCCFRVQVLASGSVSVDWGNDAVGRNGTHAYRWNWESRELLSYQERGRTRSLSRCRTSLNFRCSTAKIKARFEERSNLTTVYGPDSSDPHGECHRLATTRRSQFVKVPSNDPQVVSYAYDRDGRPALVVEPSLREGRGPNGFDDACWHGFGQHSLNGQETTEPKGRSDEGTEFYSFDAFEFSLQPPHPDRLRRATKRFSAPFDWDLSMPASHTESDDAYPHKVTGSATARITFTPFPPSQWKAELRKLRALR